MALSKYKLGELIKQRREKYDGSEELPIRGVAREGFISPKQDGADLSIYNVYYLNDFVFNPARMELNSIALNMFWNKAKYIELTELTNENSQYGIDDVMGISIEKKLIRTKADMKDVNLAPYLLIQPNEFAYVTVTSRNGGKISIALNDTGRTHICSSSYVVFRSKNIEELLPQYLMLFLSRNEFNRYARFHSWGSARENFNWEDMCDVQIPIPGIEVQKSIAEMYTVYNARKKINEQLKAQIKSICPILIRGSLEEGK